MPKRTGADKQIVEQAKELLMRRHGISEAEAHRTLQRFAMDHGMKMTEYAEKIIRSLG